MTSGSAQDLIRRLATRAGPARTTVVSGAGISMAAPASLPSGASLTQQAIAHAFEDGFAERVADYYRRLSIRNPSDELRTLPRLEVLLDVAAAVHGMRVLETLMAGVRNAEPNRNHELFAHHLEQGGMHVTANFDMAIERAADDPVGVIHFHGHLGRHDRVEDLGDRWRLLQNWRSTRVPVAGCQTWPLTRPTACARVMSHM